MERAADRLVRILKRRRKSIGFWDWPDHETKELALIEEFIAPLPGCVGPSLHTPRLRGGGPPDIVAEDAQGRPVGIVVAPLLGREVGGWEHRQWTGDELINQIDRRIEEEDGKEYHGGPYSELLLLIHTDEPTICFNDHAERLQSRLFLGPRQLSAVYLLFSYDRTTTGYRCIRLRTG